MESDLQIKLNCKPATLNVMPDKNLGSPNLCGDALHKNNWVKQCHQSKKVFCSPVASMSSFIDTVIHPKGSETQ